MTNVIPGPGYGPLEGAPEIHEPGSPEPAGAPRTCATCSWGYKLNPGHAIICGEKWQRCKWNDAIPLTSAGETCEEYRASAKR